jgi:hypothetical protein
LKKAPSVWRNICDITGVAEELQQFFEFGTQGLD